MAILVTFLLGVGNFACHGAILERRRRLLQGLPGFVRVLGGRASLAAEFAVLLAAMLFVANGHSGWGWAYFAYTLLNVVAAWLMLSLRP